jgi:hypothetical protein
MKIQKFTTLKKILIALLLCISASQSIAQNSNGIFFQAVARDNFSNPAKDRNIYVESSIIQTTVNGTKVLIELHKTRTDAMGVFNITIGNGQRTGGSSTSIATIDWSKGPFYLNLKIAITPFSASDSWDYSKELVDIGTTSFGAVPFAFYSASSAKVGDKLDATDTTKMLAVYAKAMAVQSLATDVSTKLTAADTLTMLAPYAKAAYTIDSNFFRSQLATKLNITDTINYTKQKYTDSAFSKKLNIADSSSYVTPSKLAVNLFDQTPLKNAIATKLNIADSTKYVTPTKLAANLFDQTPLKNEIATKLNIADSTKYVTPTKLASYYTSSTSSGTTVDTASLSNRINLKASSSDVTNAIALNTSAITTNTSAITANTTAIAAEATTARAAELALTNTLSSNTVNINANTASITANTADIITNRASITTNTSAITTNTTAITANTTAIAAEATTARAAELALTNSVSSNTTNISSNTASITANTTSIGNLNFNIASNTLSITANTADIITNRANIETNTTAITANTNAITTNTSAISADATTARAAELALTNSVSSNTTNISSNTASITANTSGIATNTTAIAAEATTARAAELALTNSVSSNTASITTNTSAINTNTTAIAAEATTARAAELVLTNNIATNTTSINTNTANINSNITAIGNLNTTIASNTTNVNLNTTAIAAEATTARAAELALTNNVNSNTANTTSNTSAIAANTASILTNTSDIALKAPIISPTFTGTPTAPTAAAGINTTQLATTAFVNNATSNINASSISGTVALSKGGTGQTTIAGIQTALGLAGTKVAIGADAGLTSQSSGASAFGGGAGQTNQGAYSVAIGYVAGQSNQGTLSVAVGNNAAQSGQGSQSVAIGYAAGQNSQGANAVAIGGFSTSSFTNSIAIGYKATTTAANTIQLGGDGVIAGSTAITNVKTTGTLTAGTVTYPNTHNSTAGQLLSINATGTAAWTTPASSGGGTHAIGDSYCGGTVFYVWDGGAHGLIGAKEAVAINVYWSGNSTANTYANKQGILGGQFNTERILKTFPVIYVANPYYGMVNASIGAQPAAYIASSYRPDYIENGVSKKGLGDWYLPNLEEMEIMMKSGLFNYLTTTGTPSANNAWWTSYERTDYPNLTSFFYGNTITNGVGTNNGSWSGKNSYQFNVTAIRSF